MFKIDKIAAFVSIYESITTNNFLFEFSNAGIGDDMFGPFHKLKAVWESLKVKACTPDKINIENIDLFIFMDIPADTNKYFKFAKANKIPMYLLIMENVLICAESLNFRKHSFFKKIFTYQDELIDNEKYYKLNYSHQFPNSIPKNTDRKLCTLIAGCRTSHGIINQSLDLYSKRIEAIRWFEKNNPDQFDIYDLGWNKKHTFRGSIFKKVLNRIGFIRKLFTQKYPSYCGEISKKHDVLKKYKFAICYENCKDIKGYITEKIFDCFFAGCIPIYWGADNITDHIPESCFIDKRRFNTYESLYDYLMSISEKQYLNYLYSIEDFLKSEKGYPFSADYFVQTLTKEIIF